MVAVGGRHLGQRVAVVAAGAIAVASLRRWSLRWGAADHELRDSLPGDDILSRVHLVSTRAITIASRPADVWPWVAQLGQGRGGFYSYDALENLIGCQIHSAEAVIEDWTEIAVGDEVRLHPDIALKVSCVQAGHALVLRGAVPMGNVAPPYDMTWAFVVRADAGGSTRLVVRERYQYRAWWAALVVEPVELVSFLMSQRMLRGIKFRAEHPQHVMTTPAPAATGV
jgi:hypothetical protein